MHDTRTVTADAMCDLANALNEIQYEVSYRIKEIPKDTPEYYMARSTWVELYTLVDMLDFLRMTERNDTYEIPERIIERADRATLDASI